MGVTVGNVSSATSIGSGSSISWSHTSNSNTVEIICGNADGSGGRAISSVTVNGAAATILGQVQNSSYFSIGQALLTGVATSGTLAIVVTLSASAGAGVFASARSLIGVDQTTPTGTTATNFGTADQAATVSATSVSGDLVVGGINVYSTTNSLTIGNSDWYATGGALTLISGRGINNVASGTSTTIAATGGGGGENKWVAVATAFKAASGGGNITLSLTGQAVTASAGTIAPSTSIGITGQSVSANTGNLGVSLSKGLTGTAISVSSGILIASLSVTITGTAVTSSSGLMTPSMTLGLNGSSVTVSAGFMTATGGDPVGGSIKNVGFVVNIGSMMGRM